MVDREREHDPLGLSERIGRRRQRRPRREVQHGRFESTGPACLFSGAAKRVKNLFPEIAPEMFAHGAVLNLASMFVEPLLQPSPRFGRVEIPRGFFINPQNLGNVPSRHQQVSHGIGALAANQAVRVLAVGQKGDTQRISRFQYRQDTFDDPPGGPDPRFVAVQANDRFGRERPQEQNLLLGQRGAERGDDIPDPRLMHLDRVHVALDHRDRALGTHRGDRVGQAVKGSALVKKRRFGGVEILGLAVAENPPAEGDDLAPAVLNRKHDPAAEAIVRISFIGFDQQPGFDQAVLAKVVAHQRGLERVAPVGRVAETELGDGFVRESPAAQVFERRASLGHAQRALEERARHAEGGDQRAARFVAGARFRVALGQRHSRLVGQPLDRFRERQSLGFHDEIENAAVLAAAEAMVETLVLVDGKRGRLFLVKRAEPEMFAAAPDQAHALAHEPS